MIHSLVVWCLLLLSAFFATMFAVLLYWLLLHGSAKLLVLCGASVISCAFVLMLCKFSLHHSTHGARRTSSCSYHYYYPILHSLHVFSCLFVMLFLCLTVIIKLQTHTAVYSSHTYSPSHAFSLLPTSFYQPVPHASVCTSFDKLHCIFLCKLTSVSIGLNCFDLSVYSTTPHSDTSRRKQFFFTLLLLLAGDISTNPGPTSSVSLNFCNLNIRSAASTTEELNKPAVLQDFILNNKIDILTLSETWLTPDSLPSTLNSLTPPNFSLTHVPRPHRVGGGLACIHTSSLKTSKVSLPNFSSFESQCIRFALPSFSLTVLNIYRPPSSSKANFISDFSTLLENLITLPSELLITGDFNFHLDVPIPPADTPFLTLLDCFALTQHVSFPTHVSNHTLDLLITRSSSNFVRSVSFTDPALSDHFAILASLSIACNTRPPRVTKTIRAFHKIDTALFRDDIISSCIYSSPADNFADYLSQFNSTLTSLLDKHAPQKTISCSSRLRKPFITSEILHEKSKRSKLETIYRRSRTPADLNNFKVQSRLVAKLITSARRAYFKSAISKSATDPKKLWSTLDSLLSRSTPPTLPNSSCPSTLASGFLNHFNDKVARLSASFPPLTSPPQTTASPPPFSLSSFTLASTEEVHSIIMSSTNATCSLDVIPTFLLKSCIDALIKPITTIINFALKEGTFPPDFKHAVVHPKLKKLSLPVDDLSSYRPISNLNFISKILERIIHTRINRHLQSFPSAFSYQSAYRKFHSTETALLRVSNDLLTACDKQEVTALVFLDLSAAFDTIDHKILLERLSTTYGISGTALSLLSSYMGDRTQSVSIGSHSSRPQTLSTGVPQGSVLGPLLFCLYTSPISSIFKDTPISSHFYADDSQLYISFSCRDSATALNNLSTTLDSTYDWLTSNRLSVNPSKTEYLLVGTAQQRSKILSPSITFHSNTLTPSSHVRNLGVVFDPDLSFNSHISNVCRSSFLQIRQLRQARSSLDTNSAIILANALVTSKLDYCNSLFYNLPTTSIARLQRVQNALARVVCPAVKRTEHITPTLRKLHWLPVQKRILFKIALLTFKTLHYEQPTYLRDLLNWYTPTRNLRSLHQYLLDIPDITSAIGRRSFSYSAPTIWKTLPVSLRSTSSLNLFLSRLKTHLFPP